MNAPADSARELLSIGIPTYNRARFVKDLLLGLEEQIRESALPEAVVRIYVSDNASPDETSAAVQEVAARLPHLDYHRQKENVGVHRNVMACARRARGRFCWICGDDELLQPGGLKALIEMLKNPGDLALIVSLDVNYRCALPRPARFASYRDYALSCARTQPHILLEHTLISSNIYRTEMFDQAVATARIGSDFGHMYAVVNSVIDRGGAVLLPAFPLIAVRPQRPPTEEWPADLERSWLTYLEWQKEKLGLEELKPQEAIEFVRQVLFQKITRHPFQYVWQNLLMLRRPQSWFFIIKRLWFHLHRPQAKP